MRLNFYSNNSKRSKILTGVIYSHPSVDVNDLNKNYVDGLLNKISKEEKTFLGDLNINLINYKNHRPTNDFLASHPVLFSLAFSHRLDLIVTPRPLLIIFLAILDHKKQSQII